MLKKTTLVAAVMSLASGLVAFPAAADSKPAADTPIQTRAIGRLYTMSGKFGNKYNVRSGPGTKYSIVTTVKGKGKSLPCWYDYCTGVKHTSYYACYAGAPKENAWVPLSYKGQKVWAAQDCGALGR